MKGRIKYTTAALGLAVSLLSLVPAVLAHGGGEGMKGRDMEMDMGQGHSHGHGDAAPKPSHDAYPESYFSHPELQGVLYAHIAVMVLAWVFVLPVGKRQCFFFDQTPRNMQVLTTSPSQPSCSP